MKKVFLWMILGAWLAGMGLAGCGQTGPLYLPQPAQPSPSSAAAKQTSTLAKPIATPTQSIAAPDKSIAAPDPSLNPAH